MAASRVQSWADKQRNKGARTYLNGGELVQSTFLTLTFAFALGFMATFALPLILAFLSLRDKILTFWGATVKKGVSWTRESSLEPVAGPWPLPRGTWEEGWPFTSPSSKLGRSGCGRGWLARWWARVHANMTWAVWRRSTTRASFYSTPWQRHPVPCHFLLAWR